MMKERPALTKALDFLGELLDRSRSSGQARLPPIRTMAAQAGVSLVSMWNAVQRFKGEGRIFSIGRHGLVLNRPDPAGRLRDKSGGQVLRKTLWTETAARVERDILNRSPATMWWPAWP